MREGCKDEIFAELAKSSLPVIIKKMSLNALAAAHESNEKPCFSAAEECYKTDRRADFARALIYGVQPEYDYTVKIVH